LGRGGTLSYKRRGYAGSVNRYGRPVHVLTPRE
jgi:hypothetical protein